MPRHDPRNNRGPAIGGSRNKAGEGDPKPCKNCPGGDAKLDPVLITACSESNRLWKHVTYGTGTCLGMIEGYAELGLPNPPTADLRKLRDRLNKLLQTLEATHATPPSVE